jgi:hypothetical protein
MTPDMICTTKKGHEVVLGHLRETGLFPVYRLEANGSRSEDHIGLFTEHHLQNGTLTPTGRFWTAPIPTQEDIQMATEKKGKGTKKAALPRSEGKILAVRVPKSVGAALKTYLKEKNVTLQDFVEGVVRKAIGMEESKS